MSEETNEIVPNIDPIDVKEYTQENGTKSDKTCDSGIETNEACSDTFPASSDSETSPVNSISNYKTEVKTSNVNLDHVKQSRDNDSLQDSITSSPVSSYPEDVRTSESPSSEGSPFKNDDFTKEFEVTNDIGASNRELDIYIPDKQRQINPKLDTTSFDYFDKNKTTNVHKSLHVTLDQSSTMDNLAASSVSLDAQDPAEKPLSKSPFSRSAENISHVETALQTFSVSNDKDLDKDEILSQFSMQKKQANATQRIPDTPSTLDVRYTQIPKDILSQDIGNIVKNVHGMFSSVSGSLKYYTHRTVQKQVKNIKTIPNGKVMTDIFEDEMNEAIPIPKEEEIISNPVENNERNSSEHVKDTNQDLDPKSEVQRLQIESLERLLFEQRKENATLKERVKQQADDLENKDQTFKDLEGKLDLMSKRIDEAEREKDAAVMRYASVECAAIEARRAADAAAGAERAARAELLLVQHKLKGAHADKERIIHIYTDKDHKLQNTERELSKVREELKELEGRLKWTQSKLRMEMEAYKESSERADKLSQQVSELEAGREAAAANATDSIKAKQFEAELKECRAALILCRHEREHLDRNLAAVTHQLDACTKERDAATCSLALATAQVEQLKISNLRLEEEAAELAALRAKAALADTLSSQLERESERAHRAETALAAERAAGATCARREAAALAHAARLTATHVSHRADTDSRLDKVCAPSDCTGESERAHRAETSLAAERAAGATCARREAAALAHAARLTATHVSHRADTDSRLDKVCAPSDCTGESERAHRAETALAAERAAGATCARRAAAALAHAARLTATHVSHRADTDSRLDKVCAPSDCTGESERAHRAETALAAERAAGATCARREAAALAHAARLTATHVSHRADTDSRLDKVCAPSDCTGESERAHRAETALAAERAAGATCARREAAALAHAARLTATHVSHRADTDSRLDKAQALSVDNAALRERVTSLEAECTKLRAALTEETDRRNHENRVLARKVAELTEEVADANKKLEWEKGENGVLKKKHASAIKELNRELQRALKRCEQLEAKLPTDAPSTTTGSVTSLSSGEGLPQDETLQNGHAETLPDIQVREPDRQALIERIVSLQRAAARRSERCEFLEEHTKQLTEELRKKSRLLRQLLCSMPTGAVSSENRDLNKKQIASAGGGAMAAVWGGDPAGMTLQLSIEMNTKLQALLEDTLLNNITLKNNIDTLGGEISRLKTQKSDTK